MTFEELDVALEELETRLERLRALYEQYFLGFEKIEPQVARKDVDRRIYVLRREKIRNTGKRFKLQTIIQRYNTFQQYWQRICREIENGTYKRHLLRAERNLAPEGQLTIAARRRFGKMIAAGAGEGVTNIAQVDNAEAAPAPDAPPESSDLLTQRPPPPKPERARPQPPSSTPIPPPAKFDSLELDMGFLGSWVPPPQKPGPRPVAKSSPEPASAPVAKSSPKAAPPPKAKSSPQAAPPPKSSPRAAPPAKPAPPPAKPAAAPPKPARPAPSPPAAGLSEDRVRDLHQKLVALKRENKELGQVTLESLSRTLRETEGKLRAQHKDRRIDFDVVIRDGKAIVKPTVK